MVINIKSKAAKFTPDLIYERSSYLGIVGVWLKRILKCPLVLEWIGPLSKEWNEMYGSGVLAWLGEAVERLKEKRADAIVVPSKAAVGYLRPYIRAKAVVSGLGVNTKLFRPLVEEGKMKPGTVPETVVLNDSSHKDVLKGLELVRSKKKEVRYHG
mgnify:CR=1 FL=1